MTKDKNKYSYIEQFKTLKRGLFVHFGLYSQVGKGECYLDNEKIPIDKYKKLANSFVVPKNWLSDIMEVAKTFGAKYIVLTTRHHDGFSLYDTKGLSKFDIMSTPTKRDLIKEFVEVCRLNDIKPFFYHTLIDWTDERFKSDLTSYLRYLNESVKLLCKNYGEIGGFWFDGSWYKEKIDWNFDEIFCNIRKYQPNAIISNNGGLENLGQMLNEGVDCLIFERSGDTSLNTSFDSKARAKELCQTLNNHWGCFNGDDQYKSVDALFEEYKNCQKNCCNYLLNVGPQKDGTVLKIEKNIFCKLGKRISEDENKLFDV